MPEIGVAKINYNVELISVIVECMHVEVYYYYIRSG